MADPFLLAHLVHPLFVDIGGRLAPISIRDQMVRARMAVDRALLERLIGTSRPFLVIGAGAAGATAAIHAAAHGVPTLLIEAATAPFLRQAGCLTRWVDPVQYDWPVDHWKAGHYPWMPPPMPLPWRAGPANRIALAWTLALNRARRRHPRLLVLYGTTVSGKPTLVGSLLHITLTTRLRPFLRSFGLVLSCVGAGTEISTHGNYAGLDFWSTDGFQTLTAGDRVLISGGGDGALQDYLRVITHEKSAETIYSRLGIPIGIESFLQSAEDQAGRVYVWGSEARHDHGALLRLHQVHQDLVNHLLPGPGFGKPLPIPGLLPALGALTTGAPMVQLIYPCSHFSRCYGMNRFLVLLLATYLERYHGKKTLLPGQSLGSVTGVGHICSKSPTVCSGQLHDVQASPAPDCRTPTGPPAAASPLGTFDAVIVRHGIRAAPPLFAGTRSIQQPRQALPYHVG